VRVSNKQLKAQFLRQEAAVRELWNAFDPIGVMEDAEWPRDEYDLYVPHTLKLLADRVGTLVIADYIENVTGNRMGMPVSREAAVKFARKLEEWYESDLGGESEDAGA
jgi:hypothetical protein